MPRRQTWYSKIGITIEKVVTQGRLDDGGCNIGLDVKRRPIYYRPRKVTTGGAEISAEELGSGLGKFTAGRGSEFLSPSPS